MLKLEAALIAVTVVGALIWGTAVDQSAAYMQCQKTMSYGECVQILR